MVLRERRESSSVTPRTLQRSGRRRARRRRGTWLAILPSGFTQRRNSIQVVTAKGCHERPAQFVRRRLVLGNVQCSYTPRSCRLCMPVYVGWWIGLCNKVRRAGNLAVGPTRGNQTLSPCGLWTQRYLFPGEPTMADSLPRAGAGRRKWVTLGGDDDSQNWESERSESGMLPERHASPQRVPQPAGA